MSSTVDRTRGTFQNTSPTGIKKKEEEEEEEEKEVEKEKKEKAT